MSHIDISYRQCPREGERFSTPLAKRSRRKTAKRAKKKWRRPLPRVSAAQTDDRHCVAQTTMRSSPRGCTNMAPRPILFHIRKLYALSHHPGAAAKKKNKNAGRHHRVRRSLASQMYKLLPITDGHSSVTSHTTYDVQEG